jgi:hypothetical protein
MQAKNSPTPSDWINAMALSLAYLKDADEATVWEAIPAQWLLVTGEPCDEDDSYHVMLAGCVVEAVRHPR